MSNMIRFIGAESFNNMQRVYQRRYEGSEHDIRYEREQRFVMEVRVELPHILTLSEVESDAAYVVQRAVSKLARELADVFEEAMHKQRKDNTP